MPEKRAADAPLSEYEVNDTIGSFAIRAVLSRNILGASFLCQHVITGKMWVVKTFPPHLEEDVGFYQRFQLTREKLINFHHPNILSTVLLEFDNGRPYAVLDYLPMKNRATTLLELLHQRGKFPERVVLRIAITLLKALSYAHASRGGVIHCNFKPSNILISETQTPMISEFGLLNLIGNKQLSGMIARCGIPMENITAPDEDDDPPTQETVCSDTARSAIQQQSRLALEETVYFMSPEQREGHVVTARSNIYSLGLILYRALTGEPYLAGGKKPSAFRGVSRRWDPILAKCLAADPNERYAQTDALYDDLKAAFHGFKLLVRTTIILVFFGAVAFWSVFAIGLLRDKVETGGGQTSITADLKTHASGIIRSGNRENAAEYPHFPIRNRTWRVAENDMKFVPVEGAPVLVTDANAESIRVNVPYYFWVATTEVTQGQFTALMGYNPSFMRDEAALYPVSNVSAAEAQEFCRRLTEKQQREFRIRADYEYRLPSVAEWIFAAAAMNDSPLDSAQVSRWDEVAWSSRNAYCSLHLVGVLHANAWGLFDLFGNVAELCVPDGSEPVRGVYPMGGSYVESVEQTFINRPDAIPLYQRGNTCGFRVVLAPVSTRGRAVYDVIDSELN